MCQMGFGWSWMKCSYFFSMIKNTWKIAVNSFKFETNQCIWLDSFKASQIQSNFTLRKAARWYAYRTQNCIRHFLNHFLQTFRQISFFDSTQNENKMKLEVMICVRWWWGLTTESSVTKLGTLIIVSQCVSQWSSVSSYSRNSCCMNLRVLLKWTVDCGYPSPWILHVLFF